MGTSPYFSSTKPESLKIFNIYILYPEVLFLGIYSTKIIRTAECVCTCVCV